MILCDHHIEKALRDGNLAIDPLPQSGQLQSSSLDLRKDFP
jgi:deoxycytidine triphosphate deaminase